MMSRKKALEILRTHRTQLTKQQYKTIKGQIICGDITGALKGLEKVLSK